MLEWYQAHVVDSGRSAALWMLIGFLVTFGIVRWITLRIRAGKAAGAEDDGAIKDVFIGGVHIHHQVWGILLVLVAGLLEFRYSPAAPWREILATLFGIGAALALDEFALWLHVDDVYWSEEGRKSIDAVLVAVVVGAAMLTGTSPIGASVSTEESAGLLLASVVLVIHIGYTIICMLKGKLITGLIGLPIPILSLVGSIRLAKPGSFWARRFYGERKMARSHERFADESHAVVDRIRDTLSGARIGAGRS